jgi:chemotaxis protein MotB
MAKKKEAAHADERWLLTYADMITLLMALFMVLFSIAVVNKGKFDQLAKSLRESFAGPLGSGANAILQTNNPAPTSAAAAAPAADTPVPPLGARAQRGAADAAAMRNAKAFAGAQDRNLKDVKVRVDNTIQTLGYAGKVNTILTDKGLIIRLITDKVLFDVGSSQLKPAAYPLLGAVAKAVDSVAGNPIRVNGHTDAIPFQGNVYGNLLLSGNRAFAVYTYIAGHGFSMARHHDSAYMGFGSQQPLVANDRATGAGPKNRRVEIIVERIDYVLKTQKAVNGPLGADPNAIGGVSPNITPVMTR